MSTATLTSPGAPTVAPEAPPTQTKVLAAADATASPGPQLWRCSVATYERMIGEGLLDGFRGELIDGYIIERMPIGDLHAYVTRNFRNVLAPLTGSEYVIGSQEPIVLDTVNRPEPDGWIAKGPHTKYRSAAPRPEDLLLVVEVSDSSPATDRAIKLPLYARAGVPEYWIINVAERQLEWHRGPQADGTYAEARVYGFGEGLKGEVYREVAMEALFA